MDASFDRRTFLRRAAAAAVGSSSLAAAACTIERQGEDEAEATLGPPRPILLPWGPDAVRIAAPPAERPLAYMSHGTMQVWVDLDFRERMQFALGAHISVSTAHWRIPLPGDPTNVPIQAGDPRREFEERDMREWDATLEPTEGDVRILRGGRVARRIDIECQPLSGGGAWFSAEPLAVLRCGPPSVGLTREDLMEVGAASRYSDRDCTRPEGAVRLVTWASRESITLEGV